MTVIGVVGYGVVGRAVAYGFKEKGFTVYVNEVHEDAKPEINCSKKHLLHNCDFIFICVPTPSDTAGFIELGYILHVFNEFQDLVDANGIDELPIFVIKSSVTPGTTVDLEKRYPLFRFAVNPEFLRSETAFTDFLNPDRIIIGSSNDFVAADVARLYKSWSCHVLIGSSTTAELIKYLSNAYLTSKVAFACEIRKLCILYDVDALEVFRGVTSDRRIHPSHLNPIFGAIAGDSHCLPKDLLALIRDVQHLGVDTSLLQAIYDGGVER